MTAASSSRRDGPPDLASNDGHVVRRGTRVGRGLRMLTGVDEKLLAKAPSEYARYTALGGVVLGTATIAAISMALALGAVSGGFTLAALLAALVWGVFILNLDRWLVSTSAGTAWRIRAAVLIPRLVLAFMFGVVIAEPLVLRIFETAIEEHIRGEREEEVRVLTGALVTCNPEVNADADARAVSPECEPHRLNVAAVHTALGDELVGLNQQADSLRTSIRADTDEQARRDMLASNECNGTPAPGTSGRPGRGPECLAREREAAEFRVTHDPRTRAAQLAAIETRITALQGELSRSEARYEQERSAAIQREIDDLKENQRAMGLLERFSALNELTSSNAVLASATWFIRLFFILIDCLPVLVKFFSGTSRYEQLVDLRANSAKRVFTEEVHTDELAAMAELRTRQRHLETATAKEKASFEADLRWHEASAEIELNRQVSALASHMSQSAGCAEDRSTGTS
ncbi:DUF4407 domain-containing protein [Actinokineospora sp. NPDC004072]